MTPLSALSGIHRVAPVPTLIGAGLSDAGDQRSRARQDAAPQFVHPPAGAQPGTVGFFVDAFA